MCVCVCVCVCARARACVCKDQYVRLSLTPGSPLDNGCTIQVSQSDIPNKVGRSAAGASRNVAHCVSTYMASFDVRELTRQNFRNVI